MAKSLVVCVDGTWNAPGQVDRDPIDEKESETLTNVSRTWSALTGRALDAGKSYGTIGKLNQQKGEAIYLNGVGSAGHKIKKIWGGVFGIGTSQRIKDGYRFIAERWNDGDKIYIFGFSRGAFAARSLCGFLENIGIPESHRSISQDDIDDWYRSYTLRSAPQSASFQSHRFVRVEFLGLWDTVGALGFQETLNGYHNISPSNVYSTCHALALDELRAQFKPEYYASNSGEVEEAWFAGAHSNVGGGYVDTNLSNIALFWVLNKAKKMGLDLDLASITGWFGESVGGVRRPSYSEFWGKIPILGDLIVKRELHQELRSATPSQYIHESVFEAIKESNGTYKPTSQEVLELLHNRVMPWGL